MEKYGATVTWRMIMNNVNLAKFCIDKLGTPYIMGTNGKKFTKDMYNDLYLRNPGGWFTQLRMPKIKLLIGKVTTDCHGLIEWFVREQTGQNYDTTADNAFLVSKEKGTIDSIPDVPGICVRYKGHVGIYIGSGYVVEARGFSYGVCITRLLSRPWTHWYKHNKIDYTNGTLPAPSKVSNKTDKYSVVWLQLALNRHISIGEIPVAPLAVDGKYGTKTAVAVAKYWKLKGWGTKDKVWGIGKSTIKALSSSS